MSREPFRPDKRRRIDPAEEPTITTNRETFIPDRRQINFSEQPTITTNRDALSINEVPTETVGPPASKTSRDALSINEVPTETVGPPASRTTRADGASIREQAFSLDQPFVTLTGPTAVSPWRARLIALVRIAFGVIWAIAAWLTWQPGFIDSFKNQVTGASDKSAPAVQSWIGFWGNLVGTNPHLYAYLLASIETALAVFFIFGLFTNLACIVNIMLSLGIWSVAEGFGGPLELGKSTGIGTSIIYAVVAALLLAIAAGRYYGLDLWLTPRLGPLSFLASGPAWNRRRRV